MGDGWVLDEDASEADIDAPTLERLDLLQGDQLREIQLDVAVAAQPADQIGQLAIEGRRREADAEESLAGLAHATGIGAGTFELFEQLRRLFVEEPTGFSQFQRATALDQYHTEFIFHLLDLPTQRRLGNVQEFRCPGEVERLRQHAEVAQLPEFHNTSKVWSQT
ncbi:hypothetical protein QE440_004540 [Pseudomonas psychrotolerans]|uniref:Uncharacterized protein n=1 Tax=Pseudomonas oryzihabitans TaxID=47885 RepID=A0AAJ2BUK6_9PSED|nr:hypothetical protein [Pseudomonas psychrotolerans]